MRAAVYLLPFVATLLVACAGPPDRLAAPSVTPEGTVAVRFATIEVRDISLPSYAQGDELFIEGADGMIRVQSGLRWADDPARAATLDLVRGLSALTNARVAGEPWPYNDYPDARVELRVEEFLASERQGAFRVSGQFFVSDMETGRADRSGRFAISIPLAEDFGPVQIAAARSRAMADLALEIAGRGLR